MTTQPTTPKLTGITDKIIKLHLEGKSTVDIAAECNVCDQTVRNKVHAYKGETPRKYNRTVGNCDTGSEFKLKNNPKIARLEMEVKDLKTQRSKFKGLYKSTQNTNTKLKGDIIILDGQKKQAEETARIKAQECEKLMKQTIKLANELDRIKTEGYSTLALKIKERTQLFKEIEDDHLFLAGKTKDGGYAKQTSYAKYLK